MEIDKVKQFISSLLSTHLDNVEESNSLALNIADMPIEQEQIFGNDPLEIEQEEQTDTVPPTADEPLTIQPVESSSLLDNVPYMKLVAQCQQMYEELDKMSIHIANPEIQEYILMQKSRIREALFLSGAKLIDEEKEFDLLRHKSVNGGIIQNGTPIIEFVEPGIEIEDRVIVKAKVKVNILSN